ncbi:MAG: hypothetical protein CMN72_12090 [Sphingomonas sp.]|nr:hypothetical protein [Sphingomonas sp.]
MTINAITKTILNPVLDAVTDPVARILPRYGSGGLTLPYFAYTGFGCGSDVMQALVLVLRSVAILRLIRIAFKRIA